MIKLPGVCEHGVNKNIFECRICTVNDKITGLTNKIEALEQERDKGVERIKQLEKSVMKMLQVYNADLESAEKRIEKLESFITSVQTGSLKVTEVKSGNLTFGEAITHLKRGHKVGRWHRDDIYVYNLDHGELRVKTVSGVDYPWTPNQQEILCEDWRVIDG